VVGVIGETFCELEDIRVAEKGLVVVEKRGTCHTSVWRNEVDKGGPCAA